MRDIHFEQHLRQKRVYDRFVKMKTTDESLLLLRRFFSNVFVMLAMCERHTLTKRRRTNRYIHMAVYNNVFLSSSSVLG